MAEIDIKVAEVKEALTKMKQAMEEFDTLMSNFKTNSAGVLDDMNSDFMGIARKTLDHINDSMCADIKESLEGYSSEVESVVTQFENKDDELASGVSN